MTTTNDFNPMVVEEEDDSLQPPTHESPTLAGGAAVYGQAAGLEPDYSAFLVSSSTADHVELMETEPIADDHAAMMGGELAPEPAEFETANGADESGFEYVPSNSMSVDPPHSIDVTSNPYWSSSTDFYDLQPQQSYDFYATGGHATMVDNPFEEEDGEEEEDNENLNEQPNEPDSSNSPPETRVQRQPYVPRYASRGIPSPSELLKNIHAQRPWNPPHQNVVRRYTITRGGSTDEPILCVC